MTDIRLKSDDCHYGDKLHKFRVRAAKEYSFTMEVAAHNVAEANNIAESFCEAMSGARWNALAENAHMTFEGESLVGSEGTRQKPKPKGAKTR